MDKKNKLGMEKSLYTREGGGVAGASGIKLFIEECNNLPR
jgi:hypothetical protein